MTEREQPVPEAVRRRRRRFALVWLIPIVAGVIAIYLAATTLLNRGPLITITFKTANGITANQTQVTHKAVALGMVEDVKLAADFRQVIVHVRMNRQGERVLTDHARFWVVRPRFTTGSISGLETLVSGAYIEVDPGDPGGQEQRAFVGLEDPPGTRSDEPGHAYLLKAARLGSIGPGAPVFYRDVNVGEVLSYDLGDGLGPVSIKAFVRSPFDKFVQPSTHFWNTSGVTVNLGAQGVHVELQSFQALLSGGIAFETPPAEAHETPSPENAQFPLYASKADADAAGFKQNISFVTYFTSSVSGLGRGSPVEVFGIQIGFVTGVQLLLDDKSGKMQAKVAFELQPERVFAEERLQRAAPPPEVTASLVRNGMRAVLSSENLITGQKAISLEFVPNAKPATPGREGDAIVMPSEGGGGLDNITSALGDIAAKINAIPFEDIGRNLNETLKAVHDTVNGPELKSALTHISETLSDVQHLARHADQGLGPALARLPRISETLQSAAERVDLLLGQDGYGHNSDFSRNVDRLLEQVNETARSIRLLADYLDRHPEALLRGRTSQAAER